MMGIKPPTAPRATLPRPPRSRRGADSLASEHAKLGQNCATCHDTADRGFAIVHKKTDGKALPTELKRTKASAEACPTCHNAEDLAKATQDVKLVDEKGTEVNPHDLSSNESHDALTCFSCHRFHGLEAPSEAGGPEDGQDETDAPVASAAGQEDTVSADDGGTAQARLTGQSPAAPDASKTSAGTDAPGPLATTYDDTRSLCISCHHAGVFECGTCH